MQFINIRQCPALLQKQIAYLCCNVLNSIMKMIVRAIMTKIMMILIVMKIEIETPEGTNIGNGMVEWDIKSVVAENLSKWPWCHPGTKNPFPPKDAALPESRPLDFFLRSLTITMAETLRFFSVHDHYYLCLPAFKLD